MKIYIKDMVVKESKFIVEQIADSLKINHSDIEFEFIEVDDDLKNQDIYLFENELKKNGLKILTDNDEILSERIKSIFFELYNSKNKAPRITISKYLEKKLQYDYNYISTLFKKINGFTIQSYILVIKIEKIKKILQFNNLSIKEITNLLNYSSTAHLSYQFKKITGITITEFKDNIRLARLNNTGL
jgi:hypothetical protein